MAKKTQFNFESLKDNVVKEMKIREKQALGKIGAFVQAEARKNLTDNHSIDTGTLRASISFEVDDNNGEWVMIGTNKEYAIYVEKGTGIHAEDGNGRQTPWVYRDGNGNFYVTRGMKAKPYLVPAVEKNKAKILKIIREHLGGR